MPSHAETADGSSLTYTYLADGTKVSAVSGYGYGLKYRGSFVYETGDSMDDCLQSIAWDEGRIMLVAPAVDTLVAIEPELPEIDMPGEEVADSALVDIAAGMLRDLFFVTDHLGNVRSVVDVSPDLTEPVILEHDDYLPFGTRVQNPSFAGVDDNRYRYAGKEEQRIGGSDISLLDFGARYYDPYIARWTSIDPMAHKYHGWSPYGYCADNPAMYADPNGDEIRPKQALCGALSMLGGAIEVLSAGGITVTTGGAGGSIGMFLVIDGAANFTGGMLMLASGFAGDETQQEMIMDAPKNIPEAIGYGVDKIMGNEDKIFQTIGATSDIFISMVSVGAVNKNIQNILTIENIVGSTSSATSFVLPHIDNNTPDTHVLTNGAYIKINDNYELFLQSTEYGNNPDTKMR